MRVGSQDPDGAHRWGVGVITVLLCIFVAMSLWFLASNSQTYDEPAYYYSGYAHLSAGDFSVNWHQPPLSKELAALPVFMLARLHLIAPPAFVPLDTEGDPVRDFLYESPLPFSTMLFLGRLPMLLLGVFTIVIASRWAYRLWGMAAAIVAAGLAVTEPTFLAHSNLITPDIAVTCFLTLFLYLAWEYTAAPSWRRLLLMGVALGAALGAKFTALGVLPAIVGIALLDGSRGGWRLPGRPPFPAMGGRLEAILVLALVTGVALTALAGLYGRHGFEFWRQGISGQLLHVSQGHPAFFWGRLSTQGWWYYFPAALALKTPLPTLAAIVAAVALPRLGVGLDRRAVLWLFLPALCVLAPAIWGGVDIGIRYILPLYPLLFVAASRLATIRPRSRRLMPVIFLGALAWNVGSMLAIGPHFLASANGLAGGPAGLARFLSDSNIDWGQDIATLKRYMDRERIPSLYLSYFGTALPSEYGIRYQYLPSSFFDDVRRDVLPSDAKDILAVSVTNLHGVYLADPQLYAWLRQRRPIAMLGWSIYVYDLTGEPGLHCRLADLYAANGEAAYAEHERRRCKGA